MKFLHSLRRILRCFEMASGLRINFHKSCIVKVGKSDLVKVDWEKAFRCNRASLPISYLSLPLGANPIMKNFLEPGGPKDREPLDFLEKEFPIER
ncbi:hypothetical protein Dsin_021280 [Dipteronia sinensis]|uniref:Reverse transcriptase n=1 Tax=Dipteronia sinensis TaxID=43782 RepID=A0AAD9ZZD3_9ROSI|nr:hypothetical protein Dsin_021280 [Dipteronia sinensis]